MMVGVVLACHVALGCLVYHTGEYATAEACWVDVRALAAALEVDQLEDVRMALCAWRMQ